MNSDNEWGANMEIQFCFLLLFIYRLSKAIQWVDRECDRQSLPKTNIAVSKVCTRIQRCTTTTPPHCKRQYEGGLVVFPVPIHIRGKMGRRKFRMAKQSSANKRLHL